MRDQEQNSFQAQDPEATAVRPLFSDDAADIARPVVPLTDRAVADDVVTYVGTGNAPSAYVRAWKHRTQWMVALVFAALLAGTAAGVVGLRLYQQSNRAKAVAPAAEQTTAAAEAPQSPVETEGEVSAAPVEPSLTAGSPAADGNDESVAAPTDARERTALERKEATERESAAVESRRTSAEEARTAPARQGKKGDDDDDDRDVARGSRVSSGVYDTQGPAPYGSAAERRAAREDAKLRRAERAERVMRREQRRNQREPRARMVDSIRGIFEGRSESPPR